MASLMENLMDILEQEAAGYEELLKISMEKTKIIVSNNVDDLLHITETEQPVVDRVNALDKKRIETMNDIAGVMNRKIEELTLPKLVEMLATRPAEQDRLAQVTDRLKSAVQDTARINEQNRELLQNALDLVEFDLNIVRGLKAAPQTAEYTKGAINAGNQMPLSRNAGRFDAKQ